MKYELTFSDNFLIGSSFQVDQQLDSYKVSFVAKFDSLGHNIVVRFLGHLIKHFVCKLMSWHVSFFSSWHSVHCRCWVRCCMLMVYFYSTRIFNFWNYYLGHFCIQFHFHVASINFHGFKYKWSVYRPIYGLLEFDVDFKKKYHSVEFAWIWVTCNFVLNVYKY